MTENVLKKYIEYSYIDTYKIDMKTAVGWLSNFDPNFHCFEVVKGGTIVDGPWHCW